MINLETVERVTCKFCNTCSPVPTTEEGICETCMSFYDVHTKKDESPSEVEQWHAWRGEDDFTAECDGECAYGNSRDEAIQNLAELFGYGC